MESDDWYYLSIVAIVVFFMVWQCYVICQFINEEEEELRTAANIEIPAGVGVDDIMPPHVDDANEALDPEVLASLPIFLYSSSDEEMKQIDPCAVCLVEFEDGEKGRLLLPCFHYFHVDCIDKWLSSHSTCPLCRSLVGFLDV